MWRINIILILSALALVTGAPRESGPASYRHHPPSRHLPLVSSSSSAGWQRAAATVEWRASIELW